jgi:hypothetical protein
VTRVAISQRKSVQKRRKEEQVYCETKVQVVPDKVACSSAQEGSLADP